MDVSKVPDPQADPLEQSEWAGFGREIRGGSDRLLAVVLAVGCAVLAAVLGVWWLLAVIPAAVAVHLMLASRRALLRQRNDARCEAFRLRKVAAAAPLRERLTGDRGQTREWQKEANTTTVWELDRIKHEFDLLRDGVAQTFTELGEDELAAQVRLLSADDTTSATDALGRFSPLETILYDYLRREEQGEARPFMA